MSLSYYDFPEYRTSKRVFCVEVLQPCKTITEVLCQGVLKRIFSKQICYTYQIESFEHSNKGFRISFRFVAWKTDGQRKRYKTFLNMDQSQIEQALAEHKNKTLDGFCGEFFKRLKKSRFEVDINGKPARVIEIPTSPT